MEFLCRICPSWRLSYKPIPVSSCSPAGREPYFIEFENATATIMLLSTRAACKHPANSWLSEILRKNVVFFLPKTSLISLHSVRQQLNKCCHSNSELSFCHPKIYCWVKSGHILIKKKKSVVFSFFFHALPFYFGALRLHGCWNITEREAEKFNLDDTASRQWCNILHCRKPHCTSPTDSFHISKAK